MNQDDKADSQEGSATEQHAAADANSPSTAAPSSSSGRAASGETEPEAAAPANGPPEGFWDRIISPEEQQASFEESCEAENLHPRARRWHEAAMNLPQVPVEERWYRRADWCSARTQLEEMLETGNVSLYVNIDRFSVDGQRSTVPVPLSYFMLMAIPSREMTYEEAANLAFFSRAMQTIHPVLRAQGVAAARLYEETMGEPARVTDMRGREIVFNGPDYNAGFDRARARAFHTPRSASERRGAARGEDGG